MECVCCLSGEGEEALSDHMTERSARSSLEDNEVIKGYHATRPAVPSAAPISQPSSLAESPLLCVRQRPRRGSNVVGVSSPRKTHNGEPGGDGDDYSSQLYLKAIVGGNSVGLAIGRYNTGERL